MSTVHERNFNSESRGTTTMNGKSQNEDMQVDDTFTK